METRYHVKDSSSGPKKCEARTEEGCPFSNTEKFPDAKHFTSEKAANEYYQDLNAREFGKIATLKKKKADDTKDGELSISERLAANKANVERAKNNQSPVKKASHDKVVSKLSENRALVERAKNQQVDLSNTKANQDEWVGIDKVFDDVVSEKRNNPERVPSKRYTPKKKRQMYDYFSFNGRFVYNGFANEIHQRVQYDKARGIKVDSVILNRGLVKEVVVSGDDKNYITTLYELTNETVERIRKNSLTTESYRYDKSQFDQVLKAAISVWGQKEGAKKVKKPRLRENTKISIYATVGEHEKFKKLANI